MTERYWDCKFKVLKNGNLSKRPEYFMVEYTKLKTCELCGKVSTPKKVQDRYGCYAWDANKYSRYSPLDGHMTGILCMSCYNRVYPIVIKQKNILRLNRLINKLIAMCRGKEMKELQQDNTLVTEINNFGDARRFVLQTMILLRDGKIPTSTGMVIAANMKVVNDNIQAEINQAKLNLIARQAGHDFGRLVNMGKTVINE